MSAPFDRPVYSIPMDEDASAASQSGRASELARLQEWARVGLSLHVACNAVISMRYPETLVAENSPERNGR